MTRAETGGASPQPFGPPLFTATVRASVDDFRVEEIDAFAASGQGEHLLLTVEKRGMNTAFAARRLAQWAGVPEVAIGYAGMKDRHAVTVQRFSVHLPGREAPDMSALIGADFRVLAAHRHHRKLPRGALAGNRFELVLRELVGEQDAIDQRLRQIAERGMPNYFGEQRFGRDGGNLDAARRMFAGQRVQRAQRSILLSAARSELFNAVLAARVGQGCWDSGREGEVWMLDGSRSVFGPEPPSAALRERAGRLDIHPTGPLWGRGVPRCTGACLDLETVALAGRADLRAGLEAAGLNQERRTLRVPVVDLQGDWPGPAILRLRFALPPGSYATGLLSALGLA